ncbi:hypothetical protein KKH3_27740 [Pectobacterium actinidiae]|nr:hypothetical protein KKH3_27740 [Pectobacterium actinidiae]
MWLCYVVYHCRTCPIFIDQTGNWCVFRLVCDEKPNVERPISHHCRPDLVN